MEKITKFFTPLVRERLYIIAAALMTVLVSFGVLTEANAAQWTAAVIAAITAIFAIVNSENNVRATLYGFAGTIAVLFQSYGVLTESHWAAITGLVAAILGVSTAAAKSPAETPAKK